MAPAWCGAGSAFDLGSAFAYVHSFTEQRDNLSEGAAEIQTALATLIGLAVNSMPADRAERHRSPLRLSHIAAMVNGVLQARTMHEQIETELKELDKAETMPPPFRDIPGHKVMHSPPNGPPTG